MADSQAQPGWLQNWVSGMLGKIGLSGAAAQGGPSTPDPRAAQNPWVQSAPGMAGTANPPAAPQSTDYLKGIIDAQQHIKQLPSDSKKKVVGPQSSLTDLFKSIVSA